MVRQDKITYLITSFKNEGTAYRHLKEAPLDCLIRTILSQATNDANRDKSFTALKHTYPSWEILGKAPLTEIERTIRPGGLSQRKAGSIHTLLHWAFQTFGDYTLDTVADWSTDKLFSELTKLPGIGVKTVAILACFSLDRNVFPIDVHVHRVLTRVGVAPRKLNPDQLFKMVDPFIPFGRDAMLHLNLIQHGRTRCTARKPDCEACRLSEICDCVRSVNDWAVQ